MLFLFFREKVGAVVAAVTGAAGAVGVVAVLARAVTAIEGRSRTGVKETVFSRIRLSRFA